MNLDELTEREIFFNELIETDKLMDRFFIGILSIIIFGGIITAII